MGFKTVSDLSTDNAIALGGVNRKTNKANPTTITGYFLGSKEIDSPMSKTGKAKLHVFQTPTGNVGVWGKTNLDQKLNSATIGALTRVTFDGFQEIKGKNPMYKYKVEIDSDNVTDVPEQTNAYAQETASNTDDEAAYDEPYTSDAEEEVEAYVPPTPPKNAARPATAAQRAQVDALLGKRK